MRGQESDVHSQSDGCCHRMEEDDAPLRYSALLNSCVYCVDVDNGVVTAHTADEAQSWVTHTPAVMWETQTQLQKEMAYGTPHTTQKRDTRLTAGQWDINTESEHGRRCARSHHIHQIRKYCEMTTLHKHMHSRAADWTRVGECARARSSTSVVVLAVWAGGGCGRTSRRPRRRCCTQQHNYDILQMLS